MPWLSQISNGALCPSLTQTLAAGQEQRQELTADSSLPHKYGHFKCGVTDQADNFIS